MTSTLLHLRKLEAHNFKRFEEIEIDFEQTLTVIRGPNGRGKSTILHAVLFALFGVSAVPGGKAAVIRTGAKNAEVMLTFLIGNDTFVVRRSANGASLDNIDGSVANGTSAVTDYILGMLGMQSYKDFNRFSYSAQGDTQALLTLGASEVGRIVAELSQADYIDRIIARAKSKSTAMQGEYNGIGSVGDLAAIGQRIAETKENMDKLEQHFNGCEHEHNRLAPSVDSARYLLESASESNRAASENANRRAVLHSVIRRSEERIREAIQAITSLERKDTSQLTKAISSATKRIDSAVADRATAARLRSEIARASERMAALASKVSGEDSTNERIAQSKASIESEDAKAEQVNIEITGLNARRKQLKEELKNGVCHACERPFENFNAETHQDEIETIEKRLAELDPIRNGHAMRIGSERTTLDGLYRTLPSDDEKALLLSLVADVEINKAELAKIKEVSDEDLKEWETERNKLIVDERERALDRARLFTAREAKQAEETELAQAKADLDIVPEIPMVPTEKLTQQYTEALTQLATAKAAMDEAQRAFTSAEQQIEADQKELNKGIFVRDVKAKLEKKIHVYGMLMKYLVQNKSRYLSDIWMGIMATVTQFTTAATDGRVSDVSRDEAGDFWFTEGDERRPVAAASGGQRSMMGIGMRLALGSLQPAGAGLLLLDEPSADLDDEWAATMAGALLAQDRQIVMVTHRAAEEYSATKTITLQ